MKTKDMNVLYTENYKTPLKEMKEDVSKWEDIPCSWMGRHSIKMGILPGMIYKFNTISIKISSNFFVEIDRMILKFIWKFNGFTIAKQF